jgi:hypothetical protein
MNTNAKYKNSVFSQVYNINNGHNTEILEKSRNIGGYSIFVDKVREYALTLPLEEAMKEAIAANREDAWEEVREERDCRKTISKKRIRQF